MLELRNQTTAEQLPLLEEAYNSLIDLREGVCCYLSGQDLSKRYLSEDNPWPVVWRCDCKFQSQKRHFDIRHAESDKCSMGEKTGCPEILTSCWSIAAAYRELLGLSKLQKPGSVSAPATQERKRDDPEWLRAIPQGSVSKR